MDHTVYWFIFPACIVIERRWLPVSVGGPVESSCYYRFGFSSGFVAHYRRRLIDFPDLSGNGRCCHAVAFISQSVDSRALSVLYVVLMFGLAYLVLRQAPEPSLRVRMLVPEIM